MREGVGARGGLGEDVRAQGEAVWERLRGEEARAERGEEMWERLRGELV